MEAGRKCTQTIDATEAAKGPDNKTVLSHRISQRIKDKDDSSDSGEELLRLPESDDAILKKAKERRMHKDLRQRNLAWEKIQQVDEVRQRFDKAEQKRNTENALKRSEVEKRMRAADPFEDVPSLFPQVEKRPKIEEKRPKIEEKQPKIEEKQPKIENKRPKTEDKRQKIEAKPEIASESPKKSPKMRSPDRRKSRPNHEFRPQKPSKPTNDSEQQSDESESSLKVAILKIALDCDLSFLGRHNCISRGKRLETAAVSRSGVGWALHCVVHREWGREWAIDAVVETTGRELICREAWVCEDKHG